MREHECGKTRIGIIANAKVKCDGPKIVFVHQFSLISSAQTFWLESADYGQTRYTQSIKCVTSDMEFNGKTFSKNRISRSLALWSSVSPTWYFYIIVRHTIETVIKLSIERTSFIELSHFHSTKWRSLTLWVGIIAVSPSDTFNPLTHSPKGIEVSIMCKEYISIHLPKPNWSIHSCSVHFAPFASKMTFKCRVSPLWNSAFSTNAIQTLRPWIFK